MLKGYKTYACAALGVIVVAATALGYIGQEASTVLLGLLGFASVAALRDALPK